MMGENSLTDEFLPSILVNITKDKISPPRTPKNRLSRSYLKLKNNDSVASAETQTLNTQVNGFTEPNNVKTNGSKDAGSVNFCPNCQVPFDILEIGPDQHTVNCIAPQNDLKECPEGEFCYSNNTFHYRIYAHKFLAQLRTAGKETERPEFRTPSSSKKRQNGKHSSESPLKRRRTSPETQTSPAYKKKLEFGNESSDTSSSEDLLCPKKKCLTKKLSNKLNTFHNSDEKKSSADDCFHLPQFNTKANYTQTAKASTDHNQDNRKANVNNLKIQKQTAEKVKASGLPENAGQNLSNDTDNLDKEKQLESEENDIQIIYERVPSTISSLHDTPVKNHTEQVYSYTFSDLASLSCGYTSKAGISASEELLLAEEFSKNFEDELETQTPLPSNAISTIELETQPPLPSSAISTISISNTVKSEAFSMEVFPSGTPVHSPLKKVSATIGQPGSTEVLTSGSTPSPVKKRRGKDFKIPCNQNLITSYFQCSKTKPIEVPETSAAVQSNDLKAILPEIPEEASSTKENNAAAAQKWHEMRLRLRKRGYSSFSVVSDAPSLSSGQSSNNGFNRREKRNCPYYKRIPETKFVVDAFSYGIIPDVTVYFLSHFHSDHYGGLRKSFDQPIYCSEITGKLVNMKLGVDKKYLNILQLDEPRKIHGVMVTALDANHCPGSLMFLFQLPNGKNFLHVGDFRADPKMESYPCFWNLTIDKLFLDTTYCEPRYKFPAQNEIIAKVVDVAKRHNKTLTNTVFVCGSYTIGKEKIFTALAEALDCKIWAGSDKRRVLKCLQDPVINKRLTTNQGEARVHVCPMSQLNQHDLHKYMQQIRAMCTYLVAFVPTGWQMKSCGAGDINMKVYGNVTVYGVPYSEHSSFLELRRFVQFLRPLETIPTVNMQSAAKRTAMQRHFQQWLAEVSTSEPRNIQQKLVNYFRAAE